MSYICITCQAPVLLDPHAAPDALPVADNDKKVPDPVKEEFSALKEQLFECLREYHPDLEKYQPDVHIICEKCLPNLLFPIEEEILAEELQNNALKQEVEILREKVHKTEKQIEQQNFDESYEAFRVSQLVDTNEREESMKKDIESLAIFQVKNEEIENKYWEELLAFESRLFDEDNKRNSISRQTKSTQKHVEKLNKINVLNDIINISSEHDVATVSGIPLGKKSTSSTIDWMEGNAALGHLVLLFAIIEERCPGMEFKRIKMKPQGSFSEVTETVNDKEEVYELWFGASRDERRFNSGLAVMLEATTQIYMYLNDQLLRLIGGGTYNLPHRIVKDSIEDIPFKYDQWKLDKWNEALKCFCFNCKHLIYMYNLFDKNNQIALKANNGLC